MERLPNVEGSYIGMEGSGGCGAIGAVVSEARRGRGVLLTGAQLCSSELYKPRNGRCMRMYPSLVPHIPRTT